MSTAFMLTKEILRARESINKIEFISAGAERITAAQLLLLFGDDFNTPQCIETINKALIKDGRHVRVSADAIANMASEYITACKLVSKYPVVEMVKWLEPLSVRRLISVFDDFDLIVDDAKHRAHLANHVLQVLNITTSYKQVREFLENIKVDDKELKDSGITQEFYQNTKDMAKNDRKLLSFLYDISDFYRDMYKHELKQAIKAFSPETSMQLLSGINNKSNEVIDYLKKLVEPEKFVEKMHWYINQPKAGMGEPAFLSLLLKMADFGILDSELLTKAFTFKSEKLEYFRIIDDYPLMSVCEKLGTLKPAIAYLETLIVSLDMGNKHFLCDHLFEQVYKYLCTENVDDKFKHEPELLEHIKILAISNQMGIGMMNFNQPSKILETNVSRAYRKYNNQNFRFFF